MSGIELCDSLFIWLQTFQLTTVQNRVEDLTDGVAISQVLTQIAPSFFNESWFGRIKQDVGDNWRLKVSNLKKVLQGMLEYYNEELGQQISDFDMPDVNAIGEHGDLNELGRLLQIVLGCAINCDNKQEYIETIMGMEEGVQHAVMNALQDLMDKEVHSSPHQQVAQMDDLQQQLRQCTQQCQQLLTDKDQLLHQLRRLEQQLATVLEEKTMLQTENEKLRDNLEDKESFSDLNSQSGRRYQQLQQQLDEAQEDNYKLESLKDDYKIKCELQEKEIQEVKQQNEQLASLAEEARALKDEMDVLRHNSDKVAKYETTIGMYKKKLEDLADLKRQVKQLEDKNTGYMQQTMQLEEDLKKATAMKPQLDTYKRQVHELHAQLSEETKRADKAAFESGRNSEKLGQLQREKERLLQERNSLQETNDELTMSNIQESLPLGSPRSPIGSPILGEALPSEIKEKLLRLQHENKVLREGQAEGGQERAQLLQSLLDDANGRMAQLEAQARQANQRVMQLEAELKEAQGRQAPAPAPPSQASLTELKRRLQHADREIQKKNEYIDDLEPRVNSSAEKISGLQEVLDKKDQEMRVMEEKYKRYLDKAKHVIKTLDPKHNSTANGGTEIQALRNQLSERQTLIEHLENEREKAKQIRETEEKLLVSAWYNLGGQLNNKATEERLSHSPGAGQSFLARQRQASSKRSTSITTSHAGGAAAPSDLIEN